MSNENWNTYEYFIMFKNKSNTQLILNAYQTS